ncbi:GH116 family glycosyl-hydrolase [Novipirellula caenicola]|uniref:Glycosyl-hydrolase family 116 catalytic region domain-containing protein n=1 Tax=Novipirellula caenicola TaxID=1536901 RepID=A0ABP9VVM2_9BACT
MAIAISGDFTVADESLADKLSSLSFKNTGVVSQDMEFVRPERKVHYIETDEAWFGKSDRYLHQLKNRQPTSPPSGMRSSVPLGGLGAGTVEIRADGSFKDWNIFNNAPATTPDKIQIDDAFLGIRTRTFDGTTSAKTVRTHPSGELPAIESIEYSGAFPVSRLKLDDPDLPIKVTVFAYSEFHVRNSDRSATPCALFSFLLENAEDNPVDVDCSFFLPNAIEGEFRQDNGLVLAKSGQDAMAGEMTLAACGTDRTSFGTSDDLKVLWTSFASDGKFPQLGLNEGHGFGAITGAVRLEAGQARVVTIALGWFFPNRKHYVEEIGNYYSRLFDDSTDVASTALSRLPETIDGIRRWHQTCFDNSLPEWLQDSLVNSAATMFKTSLWTADDRFRQYESFSCPNVEPIHITFARSLPYDLFFPDLARNIFSTFAEFQQEDGYIQEKTCGRGPAAQPFGLDAPPKNGRVLGDCCPSFILTVYKAHKWSTDSSFVDEMWPHAKKAAEWQIRRAEQLGVPNRLASTYDLSNFQSKDIVSYNAFMHLAAMKASIALAEAYGDEEFAIRCRHSFESATKSIDQNLWEGKYYRNWWDAKMGAPSLIHVDTLYGQLWSSILGLGELVDRDKMLSHLQMEKSACDTPFGLEVITDTEKVRSPTRRDINSTVWQGGSMTWSVLNLYLDQDVDDGLAMAEKVINHWRVQLNDQWDYRDLTAAWDGMPWCNSHYTRQLTFWSLPMALSGQEYTAKDGTLSFSPRIKAPFRLPFYLPQANGVLEALPGKQPTLRVIDGKIKLSKVTVNGKEIEFNIGLQSPTERTIGGGTGPGREVVDDEILPILRKAGVPEACEELGINFSDTFGRLNATPNHPYRLYRWSVSQGENGDPVINALPPEEEMGWTPWEWWTIENGKPVHLEKVQFPVKEPIQRGIVRWYTLDSSDDLTPRFLREAADLETYLRQARIDVGSEWLGLDFKKVFIDSLTDETKERYRKMRWAIVPHVLAADGPVVCALPREGRFDVDPYECWYTDGKTPQIHHLHYTQKTPKTTGTWLEHRGTPQRSPEVLGRVWHWYDDPSMIPALEFER